MSNAVLGSGALALTALGTETFPLRNRLSPIGSLKIIPESKPSVKLGPICD
jgi:hypothetical protein